MAMGSKLAGIATGIAVRKVSEKALDKVWRKTRHSEPPADPAAPGTPWSDAISWAVASGIAVGVSRLVASRGMASARIKLTGHPPEGMEGPGKRGRKA
jgi:hypothetical protein